MKKFLTIFFIILISLSAIFLFGCNKHTHTYEEEIINPTCTEQGYTLHTCSCGDSYKDNYVDSRHTPKTAVKENVVEPKMIEDGSYDEVVYCEKCGQELSREHKILNKTIKGTEIYSSTFNVNLNEETIYGKVSNGTTIFKFNNDITVANGAKYYLCSDILGQNVIPTKIATLVDGDNVYYIVVENGNDITTYTVTLRVRPLYTVNFNTNGGSSVGSQTVEEDSFANRPSNPTRAGYDFVSWDFDFNLPITENKTINAIWQAPYKVEYYLQNLEDDNYTIDDNLTEYLRGTTDTNVYAEIKKIEHFTPTTETLSGNINENNNLVLKVYYTRNKYTVSNANSEYGEITNIGTYKYGGKELTLIATEYLGCEFLGWYNGEVLLSSEKIYTFTIDKNVTAKFKCKDEMANFNFTTSNTGCKITGIKDKTVTKIIVPNYVTEISSKAFDYCFFLQRIIVDENNNNYKSIDGNLYSKDGKILIQYAVGKQDTLFEIPDSVTIIEGESFFGCSFLTRVVIGNNLITIDNDAFLNCVSLITVVIGNSVTTIGEWAFLGCSSLTSVIIPDSVITIGNAAFLGCSSLTSVTIGSSVTAIGDFAFSYCSSLTSVTIGNNVTTIGDRAFYDCSSLQRITFSDCSNWYRTNNKTNWQNKTGGELTDLSNPTQNATYFKSTYYNYYWYKK